MTESESFKVWVDTEYSRYQTPLTNAYYAVAQEFQSGDMQSQMKALRSVMEFTWRVSKNESSK